LLERKALNGRFTEQLNQILTNEVSKTLKKTTIMLALLLFALAFSTFNQNTGYASANDPAKLALYTGSPGVLADNSTYQCIFVQLQDISGKIVRATQDITIGLSSSLTIVGTVDSSVIIHKGETYVAVDFQSTFYPGTTTISASATGFTTVLSTITTVGPIPSSIGVYGFPSTLPADGNTYPAIIVQLQDSTKAPARAPHGGVQVELTSSNTSFGSVTPSIIIPEGETYAIANFSTTTKAQTDAKIQSTNITAVSAGYSSSQVTITLTPIASNPTSLKIFAGPPQFLADQKSYKQIAVQLQNATGFVATKNSENTIINIASNDSSVCQIDAIAIPAGQNYGLATLNTTYKAGLAKITAVANDFQSTYQTINTFGFIASKLAIYCLPTSLPSDGNNYPTIQVQLQDGLGRPAKSAGSEVGVKLFSSKPAVGTVSPMLTIPLGQSTASGNLTSTYTPGNTTITAQTSGYATGQMTLTTYLIDSYPISASAGSNGSISPNGTISVMLGTNQSFNVTANTGYHVSNLIVDNSTQGSTSNYVFYNITQPHSIVANFTINQYSLNLTQTSNGQITPEIDTSNYGDTPEFYIRPNEGYYILNITANGNPVPVLNPDGQTYQFAPVTGNNSLSATFEIKKFTIEVAPTYNGTITPGTSIVNYGDDQYFMITPDTGCHITDVIINGNSIGPVSTYAARNVQNDITILAYFAADPEPTPTPTPTPSPTPSTTTQTVRITAVTENGTYAYLELRGNMTSNQVTNATIITETSSQTIRVSFTVSGEDGDSGLVNLTIPKSAVDFGTSPVIYIDGKKAVGQGYSEDENNYYLSFVTHFSSHNVTIVFSSPIPDSESFSQKTDYVVVGVAGALVIVSTLLLLNKKIDLKDKLENIKIF
jgi:hypothetical protein